MAQMQNFLRKINDLFAVDSQNHIIDLRNMSDTGQVLNADIYNQIMGGTFNPYQVAPYMGNGGKGIGAGLSNLFAGLRNRIGPGNSLIKGDFNLPNLGKVASDVRATQLWQNGPTIAQSANTISGLYQGGKAVKGLYDNINAEQDLNSLKQDISTQVASNPMYNMYLDANDEKLLRQVNNNTLTNNWGGAASGVVNGIPQAALAAVLGGLTGGVGGAAIGGIGSLINSGISGYGKGTEEATGKLQGLYDRLRQANEEYRTMKRPSGLRRAGLSTQYYNQLY